MLDMHKLEVSGLQCCVCVPSSLFPAAADNSYWTRSARYGEFVCVCLSVSAHGYSSLSTCVLCVCEYGVCRSVCVFQSIYLSVSVYLSTGAVFLY